MALVYGRKQEESHADPHAGCLWTELCKLQAELAAIAIGIAKMRNASNGDTRATGLS